MSSSASCRKHLNCPIKYFLVFSKKGLAFPPVICYYTRANGGIAQLGERLNGIQEVSGSIPLISTKES